LIPPGQDIHKTQKTAANKAITLPNTMPPPFARMPADTWFGGGVVGGGVVRETLPLTDVTEQLAGCVEKIRSIPVPADGRRRVRNQNQIKVHNTLSSTASGKSPQRLHSMNLA